MMNKSINLKLCNAKPVHYTCCDTKIQTCLFNVYVIIIETCETFKKLFCENNTFFRT